MRNDVELFKQFCHYDKLSGGPDAHVKMAAKLSRRIVPPVWGLAVYVSVYNNPVAEVIRLAFPEPHRLSQLETWIDSNWGHISLRQERRRPVGSPAKLADCLRSAARWCATYDPRQAESYEALWEWSDDIMYFGRYARIKFLECLRQAGLTQHMIPDIRAKGAWSAREGLAMLRPEHAETINGKDSPSVVSEVERLAEETRLSLFPDGSIDRYEFQVYLCNYKQCVTGKQYPGRSLDSELEYYYKTAAAFGPTSAANNALRVRRELFNSVFLGEVDNKWRGIREPLTTFLEDSGGKMWSDTLYDYRKYLEEGRL